MNKQQIIKKYFNQKEKLTLKNEVYFDQVKKYLINCLADDLRSNSDITSDTLIKDNSRVTANIIAKQNGIIAGLEEIKWLLTKYKIHGIKYKNDGQRVKSGEKILALTGGIKDILKTERTILNLLQRMSGIATETNKIVKFARKKVLICSTRKTPLGLLDKKAVVIGGGGTHRLGLYDWILIKDNHLNHAISSKLEAINYFWEIEVKNKQETLKFAKHNPGAIMFDNMKPKETKNIIKILAKYKPNMIFEASGGINEKNITEYAKTGVDVISIGALTHSPKALDLSLKIQ